MSDDRWGNPLCAYLGLKSDDLCAQCVPKVPKQTPQPFHTPTTHTFEAPKPLLVAFWRSWSPPFVAFTKSNVINTTNEKIKFLVVFVVLHLLDKTSSALFAYIYVMVVGVVLLVAVVSSAVCAVYVFDH